MRMKRTAAVLILIFICISAVSCGRNTAVSKRAESTVEIESKTSSQKVTATETPQEEAAVFRASVLEVSDISVLVMPADDSDEIRSSDKIWVSLGEKLMQTVSAIKAGDTVEITYDGVIAESYPAQIHNVRSIKICN